MGLVKFLCDFRVNAGPIDTRFEYAGLTVQALESRELFALVERLTLESGQRCVASEQEVGRARAGLSHHA